MVKVFGSNRVIVRLSTVGPINGIRDTDPETLFGYVIDDLDRLDLSDLHVLESSESVELIDL